MCRECQRLLKGPPVYLKGPLVYSNYTTAEAIRLAQQHFKKRQDAEVLLQQSEVANTRLLRENRKMKQKLKRKGFQ
jgi:hypothetical protein